MDVFTPTSEAEAAAVVAEAAEAGRSLAIEGHGSKRGLGRSIETSGVLKLSALRGIIVYEPDELVITVRAGTPLQEVEAALAEKNQCLAFEPASWAFEAGAEATIGGTVAAGVAGSRRVVLGGARDHLIGFRAVNGEGGVFKAGGRVVKNVTGYDLPKLAAASFGTLFAMTELTLRCYPRTEAPTSLVMHDLNVTQGCALLRKAVGSAWEATGFCYVPRPALDRLGAEAEGAQSLTVIRFEGSAESMAARAKGFAQALAPEASVDAGDWSQRLWSEIGQLKPFRDAQNLWRLSVPPAAAPRALQLLHPECFVADWAGGLLWLAYGAAAPSAVEVHAAAFDLGGHAMLFRAGDEMRRSVLVFAPRDEATMALTRRLKQAFDPAGILNPGRMYAGI